MKRSSNLLHYWDSCAFLGLLKNESEKINECSSVIKAAKAGEITIVTSALTFIEVIRLEKGKPKLSKEVEEKIRSFFKHEWIYVYNVDRKIAELARDLMWQHESLKPKDATHVATAIQAQVNVLETFDDGLIKLSGTMGNPLLPIRRPYFPNQLELFDQI